MGLILGSGSTKPQYPYDMWYGVQGDFTSKDYVLTRIGNMDLHRTLPVHKRLRRFVENPDGSVKYYLHQNDSRKKDSGAAAKLDTTDGNVMLEKPEYYARFEVDGTKWAYAISEYALPGFVRMTRKAIAPWYSTVNAETSTAVSGCWLQWGADGELLRDSNGILSLLPGAANFRGGTGDADAAKDGTYNSQLGMPRTNLNKGAVRAMCNNGLHIGAARAFMEIAWLFYIEYASFHTQNTYNETLTADGFHQGGLGTGTAVDDAGWSAWGQYRPFIPCGVTAPLGNNTGRVAYKVKGWSGGDKVVQVLSYRGFETPTEYLFMLLDDIILHRVPETADDRGHSTVYGCAAPSKFASPNNAGVAPEGYEPISEIPRTAGWIWQFSVSMAGFTLPSGVGAGSASGMCDTMYVLDDAKANGWYSIMYAGNATGAATVGFASFLGGQPESTRRGDAGFRLCRF